MRTGGGTYRGFSLRETAGAVATVRIYDNTAASGTLLDTISFAANESAREWYGNGGLAFATGLHIDVVSGTVEGSIRIG